MKILMFGRGVIATQYAWALEKAGNTVEFFVRPGRAAQYGPAVKLDIRDGRINSKGEPIKEEWPVVLREDLNKDHDYDLIIVSINHDQVADAAAFLGPLTGDASVLFFNNFWADPQKAIAPIPFDKVVWGFPGGGGGVGADGTLRGGFFQSVTFGTFGTPLTERETSVRKLFQDAGFSISEKKDFRGWLWFHFILNAGLLSQALKAGTFNDLMNSPKHFKQVVLNLRELVPLLKVRGAKLGIGTKVLLALPAGLTGFVLHTAAFGRGSLPRYVMENFALQPSSNDMMGIFPRDVLTEARKLGVPVPRLESIAPLLKK